jgi:hypothetical protein
LAALALVGGARARLAALALDGGARMVDGARGWSAALADGRRRSRMVGGARGWSAALARLFVGRLSA